MNKCESVALFEANVANGKKLFFSKFFCLRSSRGVGLSYLLPPAVTPKSHKGYEKISYFAIFRFESQNKSSKNTLLIKLEEEV
jgi:hypothetical protein